MGIPLHKYKSNLCPYCNSVMTFKCSPEKPPHSDFIILRIRCLECEKGWGEIYRLAEIGEDDVRNRQIESIKTRKEKKKQMNISTKR
ncbi:hypothetical protein LCGC14_1154480 [marine sediment metagenome]|uniref:Uncharacterized protein n=1 Tax=marine sediment metagenome TaxID=412755 RepID=A0A0F9LUI8_9ZZZZ